MKRVVKTLILVMLAMFVSSSVNASVLTAAGYSVTDITIDMPASAFLGGFDILPNGNYVINDGCSIREVKRDGTAGQTFYSYETAVYGSFVRVNNGTLYFSDSSTESSRIMSMSLSGGSATTLTTLSGNYDMDFAGNDAFVVAGNSIYKLGTDGSLDTIATADGYSGPLAFDGEGNLYYAPGHVASDYSSLPTEVLKWTSSQVASAVGAGVLGEADAEAVAQIDGAYGFAFDSGGNLLITDNSSTPAVNILEDGTVSTIAEFSADNTYYPYLTFVRSRSEGQIAVGCSYYDSTWNSHTLICELQAVPEPSSMIALFSMLGFAASSRLLRRGK
ncbi:PEP-CTERM sorting domain-containing protein [bacterium]|nr:PEP-CTERM sorting domain-containing protein [bacterium]